MAVTATTIESSPSATQLAALRYLLPPVGAGFPNVSVQSSFLTSVSVADSAAETRRGLRNRPVLRIEYPAFGESGERWDVDGFLARVTASRLLAPLASDAVQLASQANSGQANVVSGDDLAYRRFEVGCRVALYAYAPGRTTAESFEVGVISSISTNTVTLTGNLASAWPAGSWMVPLVECELTPVTTMNLGRWDALDAGISVREVAGKPAYSALATAGSNPSGYDTYSGDPILDLACIRTRSMSVGWSRPGSIREFGLGSRPNVFGTRAARTVAGGLYFDTRSEAWAYLKFFASRAGRLHPFWLFDPSEGFDGLTVNSTTEIEVPAYGDEDDWDFRDYLGVKLANGDREVVPITSVSRSSGVDTLTLATALSNTSVEYAHVARLCRFDSDALAVEWRNKEICEVEFGTIELPDEATTTQIVPIQATAAASATFDPEDCDGEAAAGNLCTVGDTRFEEGATVLITEAIDRPSTTNDALLTTSLMPMGDCGEFAGTYLLDNDEGGDETGTYTATYNGDGSWLLAFDGLTDPDFEAVPIAGTGGSATIVFSGGSGGSSVVTITVTGAYSP
jgi:hypothetical protein